jgi:hypothetical protein
MPQQYYCPLARFKQPCSALCLRKLGWIPEHDGSEVEGRENLLNEVVGSPQGRWQTEGES